MISIVLVESLFLMIKPLFQMAIAIPNLLLNHHFKIQS